MPRVKRGWSFRGVDAQRLLGTQPVAEQRSPGRDNTGVPAAHACAVEWNGAARAFFERTGQ